jgi:hypothetical protein
MALPIPALGLHTDTALDRFPQSFAIILLANQIHEALI